MEPTFYLRRSTSSTSSKLKVAAKGAAPVSSEET
jgi:hypothetical protein